MDECDIYTDVDGVFTTDPRLVKSATKLAEVSYDEMLELASMGAQVYIQGLLSALKKIILHYMLDHRFYLMMVQE